jgi:pimeloyl-ACP methyl ester carboxylesterase
LDADLHLPDDDGAAAPYPAIVAVSGYQGLKVIHPERFARALTPRGYAVLAFDYRGFGMSEGERGRLVPQEWAQDILAGVDRIGAEEIVDPERIGLIGWGLGGGVVVSAAAQAKRVAAVAAVNGIADGRRSTEHMHDEDSWASLLRRIYADRGQRAAHGRSEITSPWDIVRLNLDSVTDDYVGEQLYKAPGFGAGVTLESADRLLHFCPQNEVGRIAPRPLLVVHGAQNELHKPEEAQALYDNAGEPRRLELLEGVGHTEWMFDDHPMFARLVDTLDEFFRSSLTGASDGGR